MTFLEPARGRLRLATLVAAVSMVVAGCEFNGVYDFPLPGGVGGRDVYRVTAEFADVLDLVPQSGVRVNDVPVGAVEKIWVEGSTARVQMRIKNSVRLPDNAVAALRQSSLLGEKYVALAAPSAEPPQGQLSEGDVIPLDRTGRNPEVEEVLGALALLLNGGGVAQLKTIEHELNQIMAGREDRIKGLLAELDTFIGTLDEQKSEIVRAIDGIDRLSQTLVDQRETIGSAIDEIGPGLQVLADQRAQLTKMLEALSELGVVGARVIRESSADTVANLERLAPILTRLAEAGDNLPKALELLLTYPFPDNAVDAIRGDYTNLKITADLDFQTLYDNLVRGQPSAPDEAPSSPLPAPTLPQLPDLPELPLPSLPNLPLPTACPTLPGVPLPSGCPTPSPSPTPSSSGGGGPLCPPICLSGSASTQRTTADADLAALLLQGLA